MTSWTEWDMTACERAMIYQHATSEARRAIADALNDKVNARRGRDDDEDDGGLGGALVPVA
ncbi:hypothetical protein [Actinomadura sp. NPDC049753]|uniref:hypothetical protein n=1 Tax=Actinomadura sp. NPDC049753 TaxID=3154739 RepID=UPI0034141A14